MDCHILRKEDAVKYGVVEAIILYNIRHWIEHNNANNTNLVDGRYWTYNSAKAFQKIFNYLTVRQIERAIANLSKFNVIVISKHNKHAYDRTNWYSINEDIAYPKDELPPEIPKEPAELPPVLDTSRYKKDKNDATIPPKREMDSPDNVNGFTQKGGPIPDINKDLNADINSNIYSPFSESTLKEADAILSHWNSKSIIKHNPTKMRLKVSRIIRIKKIDSNTVIKAIDKYSDVLTSNLYFLNYKWDLDLFIKRGEAFFDSDPEALNKYKKHTNNTHAKVDTTERDRKIKDRIAKGDI